MGLVHAYFRKVHCLFSKAKQISGSPLYGTFNYVTDFWSYVTNWDNLRFYRPGSFSLLTMTGFHQE
ncbi:hypothetical protein CRP01_14710 [Flavilitoribacter nigricans DSM 23189 = NBRC 102662]|uniref:Uncharacterized protein n=1 Tax=Flavilitoribacter nigricans (strain ATCC 23147 / DSM 23189 / NBRC 102662 / NCIMB 1420 / SS-2) TaxID=1122177 RepID=A0A2D0NB58_FLAN2|nr:hypothetical protein CRP01_14710 [Flavilitoribacter nigricans DSM 23189 = NBRC 102662]